MRILFAAYLSGHDFLRALKTSRRGGQSTLAVKTRARFSGGTELILEVGFPGLPNRVLLRATAGSSKRGGMHVFKIPQDQEDRITFLVAVASERATVSFQRRHRRFPVRIPARFFVDDEGSFLRGDAETEDMAVGGVALRTYRSLPEHAKVSVFLDFGGGHPEIEFKGQVVWTRPSAEKGAPSGVGIRFDRTNTDELRRLRWLLRGIKLTGHTFEGEGPAAVMPTSVSNQTGQRGEPPPASIAQGSGPRQPMAEEAPEPITLVRPTPDEMPALEPPTDEDESEDTFRETEPD
jgi:Tfp pilus assembly protein PilZ